MQAKLGLPSLRTRGACPSGWYGRTTARPNARTDACALGSWLSFARIASFSSKLLIMLILPTMARVNLVSETRPPFSPTSANGPSRQGGAGRGGRSSLGCERPKACDADTDKDLDIRPNCTMPALVRFGRLVRTMPSDMTSDRYGRHRAGIETLALCASCAEACQPCRRDEHRADWLGLAKSLACRERERCGCNGKRRTLVHCRSNSSCRSEVPGAPFPSGLACYGNLSICGLEEALCRLLARLGNTPWVCACTRGCVPSMSVGTRMWMRVPACVRSSCMPNQPLRETSGSRGAENALGVVDAFGCPSPSLAHGPVAER